MPESKSGALPLGDAPLSNSFKLLRGLYSRATPALQRVQANENATVADFFGHKIQIRNYIPDLDVIYTFRSPTWRVVALPDLFIVCGCMVNDGTLAVTHIVFG
jgi:hypothetical protein